MGAQKISPKSGRGLSHVTPKIFGIWSNISPKLLELETSIWYTALYGEWQAGAQKFPPKTGRGVGHVTPTIFGSTVGYPSDSLASCFIYFVSPNILSFRVSWCPLYLLFYLLIFLPVSNIDSCDTCVLTASIDCAWTSLYGFKGLEKWVAGTDTCPGTSSRCHGASSDYRRHNGTDPEGPVPHTEEVRECAVWISLVLFVKSPAVYWVGC